jgi:integrase
LVHRPNYLRGIDNALSNHIVPAFGERPLSPPRRTGYAALVVLLAGTGLRISEALGLQVGDVNFLSRKMQVARQRDARMNQFVPTKTRLSVRSVPLGQVVVDALAAHLAKYRAADDGSIFTNEHGRPLTYELWRSVWKATVATFKTHDLRHYAASALIAGGASVKRVSSILGHGSPAITLGVYAHL